MNVIPARNALEEGLLLLCGCNPRAVNIFFNCPSLKLKETTLVMRPSCRYIQGGLVKGNGHYSNYQSVFHQDCIIQMRLVSYTFLPLVNALCVNKTIPSQEQD